MPPNVAEGAKTRKWSHSPSNNAPPAKAHKPNPPKPQPRKAPKIPRGLRGPKGIKLKQLQYHKFENEILIYHYAASFITVPNFRSLLTRHQHSYIAYLIGPDPLSSTPTPPDDAPPPGTLEVGYLASVFHLGGSALGFRQPSSPPTIEWLCFSSDIRQTLLERLDINTPTQHMLFELVGTLARAPPAGKKWNRRLAYTEHKDWWESLREAGRKPCRLGLTWRSWGTELMIEGMRVRNGRKGGLEVRGGGGEEGDGRGRVGEGGEEDEDEDEDEQDQNTIHIPHRQLQRPKTTAQLPPFIYRDTVSNPDIIPLQPTTSYHSHSSSNTSMLSDRSTNIPRTQPPPSTQTQSKEQLLMKGRYV